MESWLAPGDMTARVHAFDFKVGGGYEMSLFYSPDEIEMRGKPREKKTDSRHDLLKLYRIKIVQEVNFESADPNFEGEMIMEITFEPKDEGTKLTFTFKNTRKGIKPGDNEVGTLLSTLEKLAQCVE